MEIMNTIPDLSPQEKSVMQMSWDGLTIKETAQAMQLSPKTIKNYRTTIFKKLGVLSVEGMLRQGVERGILKTDNHKEA